MDTPHPAELAGRIDLVTIALAVLLQRHAGDRELIAEAIEAMAEGWCNAFIATPAPEEYFDGLRRQLGILLTTTRTSRPAG